MKNALGLALPLAALVLAGCADKKASIPPLSPTTTTAAKIAAKKGSGMEDPNANPNADGSSDKAKDGEGGVGTQSLHLSETIAKACNLPEQKDPNPHFAFDSAQLPEADRELLAAFAKCLAGPLKGKGVLLIGRADNRGEPEYNMGLGGSRSETVKRYLIDLGVADSNIKASSRGEMDATGTDEEGWAKDRRVDIDVR